jgi:hypothetical protein
MTKVIIDIIPGLEFSSSDKELYGGLAIGLLTTILSSVIGIVLGYKLSKKSSDRAKQDQIDFELIGRRRATVIDNINGTESTLYAFDQILLEVVTNQRVLEEQLEVINKAQTERKNIHMLNLPQLYNHSADSGMLIYNNEIRVLWMNLMNEISLQNNILKTFNDYYSSSRSEVHSIKLSGGSVNSEVIDSDNKTIKNAILGAQRATDAMLRKCLTLVVTIEIFQLYCSRINTRDYTQPQQFTETLDKMFKYTAKQSKVEKKLSEKVKIYTPANMFASEAVEKTEF